MTLRKHDFSSFVSFLFSDPSKNDLIYALQWVDIIRVYYSIVMMS